MFFKRKDELERSKNYKAIYKSLHSGNIKEIAVAEPTSVLVNFLQQNEDIWEVYMLTSVVPLNGEEHLKLTF